MMWLRSTRTGMVVLFWAIFFILLYPFFKSPEERITVLLFTAVSYSLDGFDYLGVAGAAAEVAGDGGPNLGFGRSRVMIE